jgi:hypothetical protein
VVQELNLVYFSNSPPPSLLLLLPLRYMAPELILSHGEIQIISSDKLEIDGYKVREGLREGGWKWPKQ